MTNNRAIEILQCMADGIDPITGEILEPDHLCNSPEVVRALRTALQSLSVPGKTVPDSHVRKNGKLNAGRSWSDADLYELKRMYLAGTSMDILCEMFQRRERGILKQLAHLGLINSERKPSGKPIPGLERAGLPWTRQEDRFLKDLYASKWPIAEIASEMHRTEYSIYCRMEKLELFGDEYGYPSKNELLK